MTRASLGLLGAMTLAAGPLVGSAQADPAPRPNIIFVLCDDLGPGDIGVLWQNGRPETRRHRTPHLDQFAAEGRILRRHYSSAPVCAPSRASLLTGQHQGHCAVRDNQFDKELPDNHTLGTVLREAGYSTAVIGKWGLQGGAGTPGHPLNRGFDFFFGYLDHQSAHFHYPFHDSRPFYEGFTEITPQLQNAYSTDLITARAKQWIVDQRASHPEKPFFLYLAQVAPHAGLRVPTNSHLTAQTNYPSGGGLTGGVQWTGTPGAIVNTAAGTRDTGLHPEYASAVDNGQPWPDYARRYATMVRRLDDSMADLVQLLKDLGIDDNTLIVFTSDNGTQNASELDNAGTHDPRFFQTFGPYDGIKRDTWEGGIRMPALVRWPSVIPSGGEDHTPSQFQDWMATFAELAGVPVPAICDGRSIVPALTGSGTTTPGLVYVEYEEGGRTPDWTEFGPNNRNQLRREAQAVYIGDFKGIRTDITATRTTFRAFNIATDLQERTNLAGQAGVPTQQDFLDLVLRSRRANSTAARPYDALQVPAVTGQTTVPGLLRKSYPGPLPWVPDFRRLTPTAETAVSGPTVTTGADGFHFSGFVTVPQSGNYTIFVQSSGAAIVRLHNALLVDADKGSAGVETSSGVLPLEAGLHPIQIHFVHRTGSPSLQLAWQGPGLTKQTIPETAFQRSGTTDPPDPGDPPPPGFFWLPLDETTGTSARMANGTVAGSLSGFGADNSQWIAGAHGGALQFNGTNQFLTVPASAFVPPGGGTPRTITAWLRPDAVQPQLSAWLSYGASAAGQRFSLRVDTTTGGRFLRCEIQGAAAVGTTLLASDRWTHAAVVVDDLNANGTTALNEVRFYLDGQPEAITYTNGTSSIATGSIHPLTIGGSAHATDYHYAGGVDDLRVFDRALPAPEVAALAQRPAYLDLWHYQQTGNPEPTAEDWTGARTDEGLSPLLVFALGGELDGNNRALLPRLLLAAPGEGVFVFHKRASGLADSAYRIETSSTLLTGSWEPWDAAWEASEDPGNPEREIISVPLPPGEPGSPLFLRLRVRLPD